MKHPFFLSGYSDDVVIAGRDKRSFDEHYGTFFLLSNSMVIKAKHDDGWKIEPTEMPADGVTIIEAVDEDDNGKDHDDPRIPEWFEAPGYAPVCIIEADEPLEIVATSPKPFPQISPEFMTAAKLRKALVDSVGDDNDIPGVEHFQAAIKACNLH